MSEKVWVRKWSRVEMKPVTGIEGSWLRLVQPSAENGGLIMGVGELAPGVSMGWHAHPEPEVFFVVRGVGEAQWEEDGVRHSAPLEPGAAFYKVGGIAHCMVNKGPEPLFGVALKLDVRQSTAIDTPAAPPE